MSPALPSLSTVHPAVRDTATLPWRPSVAAVRTARQVAHLAPDRPSDQMQSHVIGPSSRS